MRSMKELKKASGDKEITYKKIMHTKSVQAIPAAKQMAKPYSLCSKRTRQLVRKQGETMKFDLLYRFCNNRGRSSMNMHLIKMNFYKIITPS